MNPLHNKTVKTDNVDLLIAMFPEYVPREELPPFPSSPYVLYTGKLLPQTKHRLAQEYQSYIAVAKMGEVPLVTQVDWIRFVLGKWGKKPSQKLEELCESIDIATLEPMLKIAWVTGKFPLKVQEDDLTVYDLFKAVPGPQHELIEVFMNLSRSLPFNVVESSLLTFLSRVSTVEEQEVKVGYKKLLLQCSVKIGANIKPSVRKYALDVRTNRELAMIELLLSLRGR